MCVIIVLSILQVILVMKHFPIRGETGGREKREVWREGGKEEEGKEVVAREVEQGKEEVVKDVGVKIGTTENGNLVRIRENEGKHKIKGVSREYRGSIYKFSNNSIEKREIAIIQEEMSGKDDNESRTNEIMTKRIKSETGRRGREVERNDNEKNSFSADEKRENKEDTIKTNN